MLYPQTNPNTWAQQYGLTIKSQKCKNCNTILTTDTPFAIDNWRGLTSKPHSCDEAFDLFVATKSNKNDKQQLINNFHNISQQLLFESDNNP